MFAGLVEAKTSVLKCVPEPGGVRLILNRPVRFDDIALGDSIATQGCCLTVVDLDAHCMTFQAGEETLSRTSLGKLKPGAFVNVERSLRLGDRIVAAGVVRVRDPSFHKTRRRTESSR